MGPGFGSMSPDIRRFMRIIRLIINLVILFEFLIFIRGNDDWLLVCCISNDNVIDCNMRKNRMVSVVLVGPGVALTLTVFETGCFCLKSNFPTLALWVFKSIPISG